MAPIKGMDTSSTNGKRKASENAYLNSSEMNKGEMKGEEDSSTSFKRRREFGVNLYPTSHKGPAYVAAIFSKTVAKPVPILNARRLNRKIKNAETGAGEWIPSESIVITFEGTCLPDYIKLYNLIHTPVELYIEPLKICYNCFRTGHTAKFCRSETICKCCGTPGHNISDCTSETPSCAHCKEAHQTLHPSCSAR